jgi:hypothetical protein
MVSAAEGSLQRPDCFYTPHTLDQLFVGPDVVDKCHPRQTGTRVHCVALE